MLRNASKTQQILNIYGVILFLWSIYRWKVMLPEWIDELVVKPLVFVFPVYWFITHIENKNFFDDIWLKSKRLAGDISLGVSLGLVFIISALFAYYIKHAGFNFDVISIGLFAAVGITFATAASEEILCRGFILKRFFEETKNPYVSAFNASLLFLILHIPILFTIPELRGSLLILFLATDFILSLINSFVFLDRKSLVAPILIHALYNVAILLYM